MQPQLSVVPTQPEADPVRPEPDTPPHPFLLNSGEMVTLTNASVGTVRVMTRVFFRFREILLKRGEVTDDDHGRSLVIVELLQAFACARRAKRRRGGDRRDRDGNLILVDDRMDVMFIVACDDQALLNAYDKAGADSRTA
jgi:hypothetical protein